MTEENHHVVVQQEALTDHDTATLAMPMTANARTIALKGNDLFRLRTVVPAIAKILVKEVNTNKSLVMILGIELTPHPNFQDPKRSKNLPNSLTATMKSLPFQTYTLEILPSSCRHQRIGTTSKR